MGGENGLTAVLQHTHLHTQERMDSQLSSDRHGCAVAHSFTNKIICFLENNFLVLGGWQNTSVVKDTCNPVKSKGLERFSRKSGQKSQHSSGTCEASFPEPKGTISLINGRRNKCAVQHSSAQLSAAQHMLASRFCSVTSICYTFQSPRCYPGSSHLVPSHPRLL